MPFAISRRIARRALGVSLLVAATASLLPAEQKLLLWEAKGERGKAYLFGSVHTAKEDMYPLNSAIEQAYKSADKLVVEVNMNAVDQQAISAKTMKLGVNFDGTTLADSLPAEELKALKTFCTERGLPFAALNIMKPWLAAMTLAIMEYQRQGYNFELGLDRHFLKQAKESGKEVVELESADFQLNMLASFSPELQTKFVVYSIRELDDVTDKVDALMSAWRNGDVAELEELMLDMGQSNDRELEPIHKAMFTDRNHAMEQKVAGMIEQGGTYFVVVGAGHLIGDEGVVNLLRQDGRFEVAQVQAQ
ncbi:MAG: TraB/GumN family protein [Bryobacterales bacterium]